MTVIELQIPDDLEPALQQVPGDPQQFILDAVRLHLLDFNTATDADIDASTASDLCNDLLTKTELAYYLSLPNAPATGSPERVTSGWSTLIPASAMNTRKCALRS